MTLFVNGEEVPTQLIAEEMAGLRNLPNWKDAASQVSKAVQLHEAAENGAIDRVLLRQESEKDKAPVDPAEIDQEMAQVRAAAGCRTDVNEAWYRANAERQIRFRRTMRRLLGASGLKNLPLAVQQQTIVIFTTDHGDYAGSHGLHAKGGAAYEEAINIPLYVQLPMNTNPVHYYQATTNYMCSAVDFFPMIVEFATGNLGWRGKPRYSDLANRQSIVYKIYHPASSESRTVSIGTGSQTAAVPYILFTTDEALSSETSNSAAYPINPTQLQNHVTCVRTKTGKSLTPYGQIVQCPLQYSGKFVAYDYWPACTTAPGTQPTQYEFYDYTNLDSAIGVVNFGEIGNQTPVAFGGPNAPSYCPVSGATASQHLFCQLVAAAYSSPGVFSTELAAPLTGKAADGTTNLSSVAAAQEAQYFNYLTSVYGVGPCSS